MRNSRRGIRSGGELGCASLAMALWGAALPAFAQLGPDDVSPIPLPAMPDSFWAQVKASQTIQVSENPGLQPSSALTRVSETTTPQVLLNFDTPTQHVDFSALGNFTLSNKTFLDSDDGHSTFHATENWDRVQASLAGSVDYDTTFTSEVAASGVNLLNIRHTGISASPSGTFLIGPEDQISLASNALTSTYDNHDIYTDYRFFALNPSYQHSFDPLDAGYVQMKVTRYETTTGTRVRVDQFEPTFGWVRTLFQGWKLSGGVGWQRTFTSYPGLQTTQFNTIANGVAYNLSVNYQGSQDSFTLASGRQPVPTAAGAEAEATQISLVLNHKISPRLEFDPEFSYQTSSYGNRVVSQKYLAVVRPQLSYAITNEVSFSVNYQLMQEGLVGESATPRSNTLLFTLSYTPGSFSLR